VIATDVDHVALDFGTPAQRPLGRLSVTDLRERARAGHFASGSMGPKVEAACRFVESGGRRTVITSLDRITGAVAGTAGTVVEP
jgi:carbamate kinase